MSKNTKILLIISIIVFVLAIGIFAFFTLTSSDSKINKNQANSNKVMETKEFTFTDNEGNELKINKETDLGMTIVFWSSDTENSLETLELIDSYYDLYKDYIDFYIINTNEKNDNIIEIINNCNFTFPVYYDSDNQASEFYEIDALPTLIFIDKAGESHIINNGIDEDTLTANLDILAENY